MTEGNLSITNSMNRGGMGENWTYRNRHGEEERWASVVERISRNKVAIPSQPRITQLLDEAEPMQGMEMRGSSPSYHVETPPESPKSGIQTGDAARESRLSMYLNKMSMKRPRKGDEEEMYQLKVKTKVVEKESNEKGRHGVRRKSRVKTKMPRGKKEVGMGTKEKGETRMENQVCVVSDQTTGSGGCPKIATGVQ